MAHVPDQAVVRCAEAVVQGQRQFDGAEIGREMSANPPQRLDQVAAHLHRQLRQLFRGELAQIVRGVDLAEQGIAWDVSHEWRGENLCTIMMR